MALRYFNTIHFNVLEVRNLPPKAMRLVARFGDEEVKLVDIEAGKVKEGSTSISMNGPFDGADYIWLHVYDSGFLIDDILGSCMVILPVIDLNLRPFEGWLPFFTRDGLFAGRVAIQLTADHTRQLIISILRGVCDAEDGDKLGGANEPYVVFKVRDLTFQTEARINSSNPEWNSTFELPVGFRDKLHFRVLDRIVTTEKPLPTEVLGIDLITRVGQYMWVPVLNSDGANAGKILLMMTAAKMVEKFPIRLLQTNGLDARQFPEGKTLELYVTLRIGKKEMKSTILPNERDPVWDEEFLLDMLPYESMRLQVKSSEFILFPDGLVGEAYIPAKEILEHRGEQVWVDLNNTRGLSNGRLLLWICPPPGAVYPDTLAHRKVLLLPPCPPEGADIPLITDCKQKSHSPPEQAPVAEREPEPPSKDSGFGSSLQAPRDDWAIPNQSSTYRSADTTPIVIGTPDDFDMDYPSHTYDGQRIYASS